MKTKMVLSGLLTASLAFAQAASAAVVYTIETDSSNTYGNPLAIESGKDRSWTGWRMVLIMPASLVCARGRRMSDATSIGRISVR